MFTYFPEYDIIINHATFTHAEVILTSDKYPDGKHVIVRFVGGSFVEFPPGVTVHEIYGRLEGSSHG